ncbi:MAG: ImmA/IrrE family metallo-endopeptidase [Lachnospiraceae bacterium]|nr:ImmA/IrrE family metallo-endopeptidase [Lachnospiraceae bacterium]
MENIEREANLFAAHLLITDDMLYDYKYMTLKGKNDEN